MLQAPVLTEKITLPSDQDATGRMLGDEEVRLLSEVIYSGTLTSTKGNFVKTLETRWAERMGTKFAIASSHGSAALHCAVAAINPNPGDEIITTSITDMGALTPILYQGAIPVFADVDPASCNITAAGIEKVLSPRTKAIMVTHLFGNPCNMSEIMPLARSRGIPVIEDCAQAFDARHQGQLVGTFGDIGCFSLQQGKHITTGEGGLCVSNNPDYGRHIFLFVNKAWGYGDPKPDHYFLALNYRMTELHGAVAVAQLDKLDDSVNQRVAMAQQMDELLKGIAGVLPPPVLLGDVHTYWKYCLRVDANIIPGGSVKLAAALKEHGIFSAPRYIQKPAFECEIFQKQNTFGTSRFPFTLARPEAVDYRRENFPGTYTGLEQVLVLPWNEKYESHHVQYIAHWVRHCAQQLRGN